MNKNELTERVKDYALSLGFDEFKILQCAEVDEDTKRKYNEWILSGYNASMDYLERNIEKRFDPSLLVPGAKSIILFILNYFPHKIQGTEYPQIAYYAYGKDYHKVIKDKLKKLFVYCQSLDSDIDGRFFCDSAPVLERYWAEKAGLGWIGKNSLLITPKHGSYFFIASLILNIELEYDESVHVKSRCGTCSCCIDACPTNAIIRPCVVDANRCLSYQTIENKGEISQDIIPLMNNRFFGCDICQIVCPWNNFAKSNDTPEFLANSKILKMDANMLMDMTQGDLKVYLRVRLLKE